MTTPMLANTVLFRPLAALAVRLRSFYRRPQRVVIPTHSPGDIEAIGRRRPATTRPTISIVHDPDGDIRLVGVRGPLTVASVTTLVDVLDDLGDGLGLHLDLSSASIHGVEALRCVERAVDELERRGVTLRVVGVDPAHPALVAETHH